MLDMENIFKKKLYSVFFFQMHTRILYFYHVTNTSCSLAVAWPIGVSLNFIYGRLTTSTRCQFIIIARIFNGNIILTFSIYAFYFHYRATKYCRYFYRN